jgi:large subunit ribosomal protein LP0
LRTALKKQHITHPELKPLLRHIKGEVGLVFTNSNIFDIITKIEAEKATTTIKLHTRAPHDIIIPGGQTDLEPGGRYYLSLLNIPSRISEEKKRFLIGDYFTIFNKGDLITKYGHKLIMALKIKPVIRHAKVICAYCSGILLDQKDLEQATPQRIENSLKIGIQFVAAVSVATGIANKSTVIYLINRGLWIIKALSAQLELTSPTTDQTNK